MGTIITVDGAGVLSKEAICLLSEHGDVELVAAKTVDAVDGLAEQPPNVVVVGPSVPDESGLEFARGAADKWPRTRVILITNKVSTELLRQALRLGVSDVLCADDKAEEIGQAILKAHDAAERDTSPTPSREATEDSNGHREATVVTIFSTKGGVGKSTLASNIGVVLANKLGLRTALIDLDLQFGDIAIMLQMAPERTISDAVQAFDRLDEEMLEGFLVKHKSGLLALLAPVQPEDAESISSARIAHIITLLRNIADFVIVDTPASFSESVLTALDKSDQIYAVATMDVPSIKNTRISMQKLEQLGYAKQAVRLILNRADSKVGLQAADVQKATHCDIAASVPSDRLVPLSVNKGVPVVLDAPKSAVARSIIELAEQIGKPNGEVRADVS